MTRLLNKCFGIENPWRDKSLVPPNDIYGSSHQLISASDQQCNALAIGIVLGVIVVAVGLFFGVRSIYRRQAGKKLLSKE